MGDGTVVAVGGAGWPEVDLTIGPSLDVGDEIRPHVRPVTTPGGATVLLVADGHCANTTAGEGNPIEIMDLSLALQLRALDHLAAHGVAARGPPAAGVRSTTRWRRRSSPPQVFASTCRRRRNGTPPTTW